MYLGYRQPIIFVLNLKLSVATKRTVCQKRKKGSAESASATKRIFFLRVIIKGKIIITDDGKRELCEPQTRHLGWICDERYGGVMQGSNFKISWKILTFRQGFRASIPCGCSENRLKFLNSCEVRAISWHFSQQNCDVKHNDRLVMPEVVPFDQSNVKINHNNQKWGIFQFDQWLSSGY